MHLNNSTVGKWRKRFLEPGVAGLHDQLRPGRPRTYAVSWDGSPSLGGHAGRPIRLHFGMRSAKLYASSSAVVPG